MPESCSTCKFRLVEVDSEKSIISLCRRYPPTWHLLPIPGKVQKTVSITKQSGFPQVQPEHWCGEWEMKNAVPVAGPLG
jgi:hypothetical protein